MLYKLFRIVPILLVIVFSLNAQPVIAETWPPKPQTACWKPPILPIDFCVKPDGSTFWSVTNSITLPFLGTFSVNFSKDLFRANDIKKRNQEEGFATLEIRNGNQVTLYKFKRNQVYSLNFENKPYWLKEIKIDFANAVVTIDVLPTALAGGAPQTTEESQNNKESSSMPKRPPSEHPIWIDNFLSEALLAVSEAFQVGDPDYDSLESYFSGEALSQLKKKVDYEISRPIESMPTLLSKTERVIDSELQSDGGHLLSVCSRWKDTHYNNSVGPEYEVFETFTVNKDRRIVQVVRHNGVPCPI
jgi:hypothetical protein